VGIFKAPRISSSERENLLLSISEVVYDLTNGLLYTGDGETLGGVPVGSGVGKKTYKFVITALDISNKQITLNSIPPFPSEVELEFVGGITQLNGIDYQITNNILHWNGLGLDNFIEENDTLIIHY
jgi:hypothetical protein